MTLVVVVLWIMAEAFGFGLAWKVLVGMAAVVDLIMITGKLLRNE